MQTAIHLKKAIIITVLLGSFVAAQAQTFSNINANLLGGAKSSSVLADFDSDNKMDFLLEAQNNGGGFTTIRRNLGNGTFSDFAELNVHFAGTYSGSVAVGDFYNVGRLDALVTGIGTAANGSGIPVSELWHNLANGTFSLVANSGLPQIKNGYVSVGDFDNDGKLDIVIWGTGASVQIDRNLGNGIFTNMNAGLQAIGSPASVFGVFAADFDNDGYLDVLIGSVMWRNLGNGTFTNINSGVPGSALAIGDFDNDGYLDVVINNGSYQIWRNLGNGTFTNSNVVLPTVPSGFFPVVAVGDYDNDGLLDIVLETGNLFANPPAQIWRNLGNGTFTNAQSILGATGGTLTWGDLNNDGQLDFLITGQQGTDQNSNPIFIAQVWQNTLAISNSPPTAPTNLTTNVTGSGVKLMWAAATDDHTPASGLNYNIRVGSASGGVDIVSPESDPVTGQRRVVQIGNACERLFSLLTNLSGGKYYWSVQAIDTAFAGGPFGTESTFVIPPSISGWAYQSNTQFQVTFNALATNSYTLQASTNLAQWTNLTTLIPTTNGPAQLADTNFLSFPRRYYRLSSP